LEDGAVPSEKLRKLEQDANSAFDQYREMRVSVHKLLSRVLFPYVALQTKAMYSQDFIITF
jgi:hypothetical protein